ncbi:PepSY domain-containing protein [Falsiroseomonas ponticola]|uniref:PepSY domain-containing protein n=1 Tax=Falsiroseomonas ponticola TaxID=2786951 RepID=UPI001931B69D|nr:PepSY domain-containing protein [Roseomonas ponticola]
MPLRRALLCLAFIAAPACAARAEDRRRREQQERARRALAEGRIRPLAEILVLLQPRLGGEVIGVELDEEDGIFVYEIKVLTPRGRRLEYEVDAATGRVLKVDD